MMCGMAPARDDTSTVILHQSLSIDVRTRSSHFVIVKPVRLTSFASESMQG
jgi:hypothetical protein